METLSPYLADPIWHLRAEVDLREVVLKRREQRAYLARYGRQDMNRPMMVAKINWDMHAISEIVKRENDLSRTKEDSG